MAESPSKGPAEGRRAFFRQALLKAAGPVADAVEAALPLPSSRPEAALRLRPPGALQEALFLGTCYRSGNCMDACPADAIVPLTHPDPNLSGTPTIVPSTRACVVCDSLACMEACPSGALRAVVRAEIRIGLAVVLHDRCLRTRPESAAGVRASDRDCVACIDACPIGRAAIGLMEDGTVGIGAAACVGCGLCEEVCPTSPKAVRVHPIGR